MKRLLSLMIALWFSSPVWAQDAVDYLRDVKPIFKERCFACHGALKQKGKLRLDTGALIRKGGKHGPAVVAGTADKSLLLERITEKDETERMPPEGKPLTEKQIGVIRAWIAQGAKSPTGEKAETDPRDHWAFHKPVRSSVPKVKDPNWSKNPIDGFLAAEHEKRELAPSSAADRATLLRRVYLDLIGLPPTRQELQTFLQDHSADAYEKVVDRLLASPHYAERWARHWMDVWRYSDWYGRRAVPDVLNSYGQIWRWRDWIVRAVEEDKPYDRMVLEMLAADEINPDDESSLVATGFIVRNFFRWNYNLWKKDLVEHTGKAFLGLTLNCCHCHDHKYDPISQEEYFQFRAFFEPIEIRHDRWPGEPDPGPYPKYDYGKAYGPIKSGMVRIFDETLDAKTYMYSLGDHRNKIEGKPPILPGTPSILGGTLKIEPVSLPVPAYYPALKALVHKEEVAKRSAALAQADKALAQLSAAMKSGPNEAVGGDDADLILASAKAQVESARADLASYQARLEAERGKFLDKLDAAKQKRLNQAASQAERDFNWKTALAQRAKLPVLLAQAKRKPAADIKNQAEVKKLEKQLAAADQDLVQKQKLAAQKDAEGYTALGNQFPKASTGRRTGLAQWIGSKDNPLTARVAVNYLWGWHFGRPLVESTFDFGRNGKLPSHPELLDWLAVEFMEQGWRMKPLHKLLVTSQAYRMQSASGRDDNPNLTRDQDNRFWWRFPVQRLEAEMVRDSVLHLAGELEPTRGGPDIPHDQGLLSKRRSLYFTHHGEAKMQFLELFDAANACDCYKRSMSVLPQQALAMSNSELTLRHGRALARKLWQDVSQAQGAGADREDSFITAAFEQVVGRAPTAPERKLASEFLDRQLKLFAASGLKSTPVTGPLASDLPAPDLALRARENLVQALFNHNDFVTIR